MTALLCVWNTFIPAVFAGRRPLLAHYLGQFRAYENSFIHISQVDKVEYVADCGVHRRLPQHAFCDSNSKRCWMKWNCLSACLPSVYLQMHIDKRNRPWKEKDSKSHRIILREIWQIFDFGLTDVRGPRIKWDILTRLNGIRGGEKVKVCLCC